MGLSVFDFDKTLTEKDTLFGFYREADRQNPWFFLKTQALKIAAILYKLKVLDNTQLKKFGVYLFLRGKSRQLIQRAACSYAKKIKLNGVYFNYFLKAKETERLVISASFEEYLHHLFPSKTVIGSRLSYKNGKVVGLARNMFGELKKAAFLEENREPVSRFFTDSFSDRSLFGISDEVYLVKKGEVRKIIAK